jgi:hypothetical protein
LFELVIRIQSNKDKLGILQFFLSISFTRTTNNERAYGAWFESV